MAAKKLSILSSRADQSSSDLLPWVIAVMVYLSGLALAGALAVHGSVASWAGDMSRRLTVEITVSDDAGRDRQAAAVVKALTAAPGVDSVRRLDNAEIAALLEPWIGGGDVAADLPLPVLVDVVLDQESPASVADLKKRIETVAPNAVIDDHQQWLGQLYDLAWMVQATALTIVVMVTLATIAIVIFGTHAGLATHRDTIETLHVIGAEDKLIAGEFQRRFLRLGLKGGVVGLVLAAVSIFAVRSILTDLTTGIVAPVTINQSDLLVLAALPVAAALISMITARVTVMRALRRMV